MRGGGSESHWRPFCDTVIAIIVIVDVSLIYSLYMLFTNILTSIENINLELMIIFNNNLF